VLEEVEEFSVADLLHLQLGLGLLLLAELGVLNGAVWVVGGDCDEVVVQRALLHAHFVLLHAAFPFGHVVHVLLEQFDGHLLVGLPVSRQ